MRNRWSNIFRKLIKKVMVYVNERVINRWSYVFGYFKRFLRVIFCKQPSKRK